MATNITGVTQTQPTSDPYPTPSGSFTLGGQITVAGGGTWAESGDMYFEWDQGTSNWTSLGSTGALNIASQTNPLTGLQTTAEQTVTVYNDGTTGTFQVRIKLIEDDLTTYTTTPVTVSVISNVQALNGVASLSVSQSVAGTLTANAGLLLTGVASLASTTSTAGTLIGGGTGKLLDGVASLSASPSLTGDIGKGLALTGVASISAVTSQSGTLTSQEIVELTDSTNISTGGVDTTSAQLTAPSGKSTGDFQAGYLSDDTNPVSLINISGDNYTELEWSIHVAASFDSGDEIEFRVTDNGEVLYAYDVVPKITTSGFVPQTFTGVASLSDVPSLVGTVIRGQIATGAISLSETPALVGDISSGTIFTGVASISAVPAVAGTLAYGVGQILSGVASLSEIPSTSGLISAGYILSGVASLSEVPSVAGTLTIATDQTLTGVESICSVSAESGTLISGIIFTGVASESSVTANSGVLSAGDIFTGVASESAAPAVAGTLVAGDFIANGVASICDVTAQAGTLDTTTKTVVYTGVASICDVTAQLGTLIVTNAILSGVASESSVTSIAGTLAAGGLILTGVASICDVTAVAGTIDTTTQDTIFDGAASICAVTAYSGILVTAQGAQYEHVLEVSPTRVMPRRISRNKVVHEFEDGRVKAKNLSTSKQEVELQWDYISDADRSTIMDWYHDENKANGIARTFYWNDPRSGNTEVARFLGPLVTVYEAGQLQSISKIPMKVFAA